MFSTNSKSDNGHTVYVPVLSQEDMLWYLPAVNQAANVKDDTMQGRYWTSTASGDTEAWYFTESGETGTMLRYADDGSSNLHVRAVRNRNN